jgi:serine/threonine-protein kinase RsbW
MTSEPVALSVAAGSLLAPVVARVVGAVAAQAGLELDRLNDAKLAADAIAQDVRRRSADGRLAMEASAGERVLTLSFGPFPEGEATALRDGSLLPGVGSVVDGLADAVSVVTGADGDRLVLRFGGGA